MRGMREMRAAAYLFLRNLTLAQVLPFFFSFVSLKKKKIIGGAGGQPGHVPRHAGP
jgi:hypothetical protein